ncbi:LPS export ABC transporter periplasmic protein LptC [filamentous cyanobacterium LEGE 11480]|uniref:LPS export ABC transporter periplasmic protein LptC n=1 Tax=Romeriopsis navalis LEGE 11480 TaxID=2777977 RepID=A0A928Z1L1_9CYAN|nr:LPS export ABC transporter periplasmic protein LptC [Romeriopsis navalis]MBE9029461.1 LPS export ABC transporter periplasmic protein LptC [Romeriopsis navalis LEGE 11480]
MLKSSRLLWGIGILVFVGLVGVVVVNLPSSNKRQAADGLREGSSDLQKFDNSLTFSNVTLEQADEQGKLWWKVNAAKAIYSKDKKVATVENPEGELFQDGKAVFKLKAKKGEVIQDGKSIVLRGDIIATDLRDGTVLKGKEIEWKPQNDKLFVRKQFVAEQKQIKVVGEEGRFTSRKQEAEVIGKVIAEMKETAKAKTPNLRMQTKQLKWFMQQQRIESQQPVQINRLANGKVTDQATAKQGIYNLKDQIATLKNNAQVFVPAQNIQAKSNELVWYIKQQLVEAKQPITMVETAKKVTLTGNQGQLNIGQNTATLTGNVRGLSLSNQAQVSSDNLTWFLTNQSFEANGNVKYRQTNPPFNLVGTKASGTIQNQQVKITGGPEADNRVVTEIVPNFAR